MLVSQHCSPHVQSWRLSCKVCIYLPWTEGQSQASAISEHSHGTRSPGPTLTASLSRALSSQQADTEQPAHIHIHRETECHVYLSRSWLGWTVIRYVSEPPHQRHHLHPHERLETRAVNKTIQQKSLWFSVSIYSNVSWHYNSSS